VMRRHVLLVAGETEHVRFFFKQPSISVKDAQAIVTIAPIFG